MKPLIRYATPEDMPSVLSLINELAVFEKEPDAVEISVDTLLEEGFSETPRFTCFVAELDQDIVGMALVYYRFSTWKGKALHLEDLIVKESMRGKGIGEALYKRVMEFALEQDAQRVNWVVLDWNEGAVKFYERSGAVIDKSWWQVAMSKDEVKSYLERKS